MEIVHVEKQPDARLAMIAQGLGRAVVVRGTQSLPYARADVQMVPDAEALVDGACAASRWLRKSVKGTAEPEADEGDRSERLMLAAALTEDAVWASYENAPATLKRGSAPGKVLPPPAFCAFSPDQAEPAVRRARTAVEEALASLPMRPRVEGKTETVEADEADSSLLRELSNYYAYADSPLMRPVLMDASSRLSGFEDEAEAEAEDLTTLLALETQLWLELDMFLQRIAAMQGSSSNIPIPKQLLCLLPPQPAAPAVGWPDEFVLSRIVAKIEAAERDRPSLESAAEELYDPEPYVPLHPEYPPRRRVEKLSYSVWLIIREPDLDLQPVLETTSTADRLRMALVHIRDLVQYLPPVS